MNVFLDTISGDAPSQEIVKGAVEALRNDNNDDLHIVLVGDEVENKKHLRALGFKSSSLSFFNAPQRISMSDNPVAAVRKNPDSSMVRGCMLLREQSGVFLSPGNTGAVVAAALLKLGRVSGVDRPGLTVIFPTLEGKQVVLIDVGATIDASPKNLAQFAVMGEVFARDLFNNPRPRVGLLNIGEEKNKGNKLTKKATNLISKTDLNFIGNVEPHLLLTEPPADVVVCEGFVGNILLKAFEGGAEGTIRFFREAVNAGLMAKLGGLLLKPTLNRLKDRLSFSYLGAAPLLGVNGVVYVGHGRSQALAIKNAILNAQHAPDWGLPQQIREAMSKVNFGE